MNKYLSTIIRWRPRIIHGFSIALTVGSISLLTFFLFVYTQSVLSNVQMKKDILGAQVHTTTKDLVELETSRTYWKQILMDHPDYEDAYVQLVILSYQVKDDEGVKKYISALQSKNPNHVLLTVLQTL